MIRHHHVQGYENFLKYVEDLKKEQPIYILYTGSKLDNGKSWCPDCVEAEPYIEKGFERASKETQLVIVEVGDRPFWKDLNCPFRINPVTKLKVLPTLSKWGTQKRLEGNQLLKPELIDMLLTDEDD
ncbi:thioredoxin domain-containing protein 17-like [Odontomachus brunneus]|uniref:thioredoxin domain-containing protein 17-like n=1 Tax=Odontomachus brunneus TaxID=486640 RepID=UPI0013F1F5FB|nr:thioredoxin domain-containing protein 17-like [Odontomachus brunneus]XP_032688376.1 thioredoxin domain-containing protein 17-like [Odontomachus brunneus]XP_032688377.1 thioredoxin domain-containing protein 17-like [Odontomachus brunneus]XP_032688378.1 thioredoxin domain-containing protein 17-like [Odontomachus brunneus]